MRKKIILILLGLGWLLLACSSERQISREPAPTAVIQVTATRTPWTATVSSPTLMPSATPTLPATATSRPAPTVTPGLSVTPLVSVEGVPADGTCVSVNDTVTITAEVFSRPDFEKEIVAYLNAGGSISGLPGALASTSPERAIRMQIAGGDITGNEIPDLFIGITLPYTEGDGETHLLFFTCVEGRYEGEILFRRAGAGSRMEGLYAGGGVVVENVGDLNRNGKTDLFFSVNWPGYAEYFVVEWDGRQFVSLIEYKNLLGNTCHWIEVLGEEVGIVDVEGDGLYEIVVGELAGEETVIWQWNGERYSHSGE